MRFGVLGPLVVWTEDGEPVPVPGLKVRALLADLLVHDGHPVSVDRLVEDLWGGAAPANPTGALQVRVSQLRRALAQAEPAARELVESQPPGYALRVAPEATDAGRFAALVERASASPDPRARVELLTEALGLWRGPALADFADEPFARAAITRLEEQRLAAYEQRAEARLELGEHRQLTAELADLLAQHPYRERLRAAQMRALYRAGRQPEALASFQDLRRRLADELGLDPSPELAALHQAILTQDPAEAAAAPDRPRHNLPVPLSELIGRDQALAELQSTLADRRLVTLTGPGGVGKTRLAIEAGHRLADAFPDGVWLVELAGLAGAAEPSVLADQVSATLGIQDRPGASAPAPERLVAALGTRTALLVLDNCEHLVGPAAELVDRLLAGAAGLRVLVTSRERLGLGGEVVREVPPLPVPDPGADPDPVRLRDSGAVKLFAARATDAGGFTLDAGNGPAVARLCRRLDGIPLALELAATRVRALGVHELEARLDDRFRQLAGGPRDAPPRHQTLAAVIDWSWQLLSDPERTVLRRLAVHTDGCTLAAAEAVCSGADLPPGEVLDLLAKLVDRSLVVMEDHSGDGARYRLLESVAAYCLDRLSQAELARLRQRHAGYYLELAEWAEPRLYGGEQRHWLRRLDAEAGNLRAAMATVEQAEPALRLANALTWYWFLRGRLEEACRWLASALAAGGEAPPALAARAETWHAGLTVLRGESGDGWPERLQAALARYGQTGDRAGRARAEWFLSSVLIDRGDLDTTERLVRESLATFRSLGDQWGEAAALCIRAKLAHIRGDLTGLRGDAERSVERFRALGDDWGLLQATGWLSGAAEMAGEYELATRLCRDGLRLSEQLGQWAELAGQLGWLAWITLAVGDYPRAQDYAEQALRLATEPDLPMEAVLPKLCLAFAARRDGKLDLAEERLHELVELARRQESPAGSVLYLSMVLTELGWVAGQRGEPAAALAYLREAFDIGREQQASRDVAWAVAGMAGAVGLDGRPALAAKLLGAATAAQAAVGVPLAPSDREDRDRVAAAARAALGGEAFEVEFAAGVSLPPPAARSLVDDREGFDPR